MGVKYASKWQYNANPDIVCVIGQGYIQDEVSKHFVIWPNNTSRLLKDEVIEMYFTELKETK